MRLHTKLYAFLILIIVLSIQVAASQNSVVKYSDNEIRFSYPSDWVLDIQKTKREIRLRPINWTIQGHINEFAVYLTLSHDPFEIAAKKVGFVRKGNKWVLEGRQGIEGDVEEIKSKKWFGLNGEAPFGTSQGLAYGTTIIITDGKKCVVLIGEALETKEGVAILNSIEFVPAGN